MFDLKFLYFPIIIIIILLTSLYVNNLKIYVAEEYEFEVSYTYEETTAALEYFDVSKNNNICISYYDGLIYEYDSNGRFIRIIKSNFTGMAYVYYKDDSLVIYDVREDKNYVFNEQSLCIETFESSEIYSGFYIAEEFSRNINYHKNGYNYKYINANWFERVFANKKSKIIVQRNETTVLEIEENFELIVDLVPIITVATVVPILICSNIIRKRRKQNKINCNNSESI